MHEGPLPTPVRRLLQELPTVDHVEVLLLVERDPTRKWSAGDVAAVLYGDTRLTSRLLRDLAHHGLLSARPGASAAGMDAAERFQYDPATSALAEAVSQLHQAYDQEPFTVIRAMFTKRAPVARSLADAFRIRRPKDDDPSGNG